MQITWKKFRRAVRSAITAYTPVLLGLATAVNAGEKPATGASSFQSVLDLQNQMAIKAVGEYVQANPHADDVEIAYRWMFTTAETSGLELDALPYAEAYLKKSEGRSPARKQALRVLSMGSAKNGKIADAVTIFKDVVKELSIREPDFELDFGALLVEYAQLHGDAAAGREIYDALSGQLFLNQSARSFCEHRMGHLELIKQGAPKISVTDLEGKSIDLSAYAGKVVLVDFWASDCAPCLQQFPSMKKLYSDYHDKGFEIVGITLDEQPAVVDAVQKKLGLPWRLALSKTDNDDTRRRYRAEKVPTTYLVDQKGTIAYADLHGDRVRLAVEKLLGIGK